MNLNKLSSMILAAVVACCAVVAHADVFNMGAGLTSLEMVQVGNPGNAADSTGYGAVEYAYSIGKYEVTAGQYTEFLNLKAQSDPYELYRVEMGSLSDWGCNIQRSGVSGNFTYSVTADWANRPVNFVSFWAATRFTNWLHNGQGAGDTETGAYTLTAGGISANTVTRNAGAQWWIPSEDEWYKAAYHKNDGATGNYFDYPTSGDTSPSNVLGIPTDPGNNATYYDGVFTIGKPYYRTDVGDHENSNSPYGTFDQGGNVSEWNDTIISSSTRGMRGGQFSFFSSPLDSSTRLFPSPSGMSSATGFRVASAAVPEPGSLALWVGLAGVAACFYSRKHRWLRFAAVPRLAATAKKLGVPCLIVAIIAIQAMSVPAQGNVIKELAFDVDGELPSASSNIEFYTTGIPEADAYSVSDGLLKPRTINGAGDSSGGNHSYLWPDVGNQYGNLNPDYGTIIEARLRVNQALGSGGIYFGAYDGAGMYSVEFQEDNRIAIWQANGTISYDLDDYNLNYIDFLTYRLEALPASDQVTLRVNEILVASYTAITSGGNAELNGFSFGDGYTPSGNAGSADWDYIRVSQTAVPEPGFLVMLAGSVFAVLMRRVRRTACPSLRSIAD